MTDAQGIEASSNLVCDLHTHTLYSRDCLTTLEDFLTTCRRKGLDRVALVSDAAPLSGLPKGEYEWGPETVFVGDRACRLADGTLAGAHAALDQGLRTLVRECGIALAQAIVPAAAVPATVLGLAAGRLAPGCAGDVVLLDPSLRPVRTFVGGVEVYRRKGT